MTIFGWDASDYDWDRGPMDLGAAAHDGIKFFTYKLTEGTNTKHIHAGEALNRARSAGIEFVGGYHVVRSGPSVSSQISYLLSYADQVVPWWRNYPGWFWQIDGEKWPYDPVNSTRIQAFAAALLTTQPRKFVITYASNGQYGNSLTGITTPLWNASYGNNQSVHYLQAYPGDSSSRWNAYSGQTPVMLQYGSQLTIGSQHECDANAFRGSIDNLRVLIEGGTKPMTAVEPTTLMLGTDSYNHGHTLSFQDVIAGVAQIRAAYTGEFPPPVGSPMEKLLNTPNALAEIKSLLATPPPQPVITDAQLDIIAQKVAALLLPAIAAANSDVISGAVKVALREGTG